MTDPTFPIDPDAWRQTHLGRLLGHAMRRFDERVLALMAHDVDVPLALSNLAARAQVSAAHIHITRHLAREGSRLTELAERAGMTKQAMGDAGRPVRGLGPGDARPRSARCARPARAVHRRRAGLAGGLPQARWRRPRREFRASVGDEIATVVAIGLEAYAAA